MIFQANRQRRDAPESLYVVIRLFATITMIHMEDLATRGISNWLTVMQTHILGCISKTVLHARAVKHFRPRTAH